jgi:pyruvate dehydrogenase E2 component (dihydrolipoyllysine-residue acetyltransferase)
VIDFTLPELGENITSGDVLRILVQPGDTLARDQTVLELETDKATIEVPSSLAGQVREVKVKAGDKVKVGQAILTIEESDGREAAKPAPPPAESTARPAAPAADAPRNAPAKKKAADAGVEAPPPAESARRSVPGVSGVIDDPDPSDAQQEEASARGHNVVDISRGARTSADSAPAPAPDALPAPAAPLVRRIARELGVDINEVPGSGPGGRISIDDVKTHVSRLVNSAAAGEAPTVALPDFNRWGQVERQPMRAVRRKTAAHLTTAWTTIPHVTQHDQADITAVEEFRKRYVNQVGAAGGHLTVTAIAAKVAAAALKVFPQFNASIDMAAEEIVYKKYVHIGIAVDTDRGLLVPVIRDVDTKNLTQISIELAQLSEKARARKLSLDEMQGGCFSISNLGGIGGTSFTPIINTPEVAILGIARARMEPVYRGNEFVPRLMLPLSLSYDHRVIDGADGIRFLRWIVDALEQPFLLALQG